MKRIDIAKELIAVAEVLSGKKGEVPEAFKKQWKNKDKDGDGKENEPKPDFLKKKEKKAASTFKCPTCGTKVLENTGYCLKCKKKVKKAAVELWEKVARQYARKKAHYFHAQLLKQAENYSDDKRLNPVGDLWIDAFLPVMMEAAIAELKKMKRSLYS